MKDDFPPALPPRDCDGSVVVSVGPDAVENSEPGDPGVVPVDVVPTTEGRWPGFSGRPEKGKITRNLKRGIEVSRVRGFETKRQLVQLHCFEGKSLPECARLMGRHYRAIHATWRAIVAEASGERGGPDYRKQVKALCDRSLRELLQVSMPLVGESAAHGAVVLKTVEALRSLHGVDGAEDGDASGLPTLEEIGAQVRAVSPLLAGKLERVKALGISREVDKFVVGKE